MRENYKLTRLYLEVHLSAGAEINLSKSQAHYLVSVLRMADGGTLRVFNGRDGEWRASVSDVSRKSATITIAEQLRPAQKSPDIWLCFAPVRKHRNSFILEKATELGVSALKPVTTARTQFGKMRLDKMHAQIIEAAEQTERLDIPELDDTTTLNQMINSWPENRTLIFADEKGDAAPALEAIQNISGPAALLIGPEGGFEDDERTHLRSQSYVLPVSLGPRILRADTAAISLLTLWQAVQGDWN